MQDALAKLVPSPEGATVIALFGKVSANSAPALERAINELRGQSPQGSLTLDADALDYISSAGLRVVTRLLKAEGGLSIINASNEVYDVFEMTGLSQMIPVRRRLRELSLEGATLLGRGSVGEVWRLDAETVIKVYNEGTSLDTIDSENRQATAAFTAGIPCAIAFDTVRVGGRYGIVFELLEAQTVGSAVHEDPARIPDLGRRMGELLREMHGTHMVPGILPTIEDKMAAWIDYLEAHYLDHGDAELMREVASAMPRTDTLLHLDFHEGNVMIQGDELLLIDLDDVCCGNPLYDLAFHHGTHALLAKSSPDIIEACLCMSADEAMGMYHATLETYFGGDRAALEAHGQAMGLLALLLMLLAIPKAKDSNNMSPERAQAVIGHALPQFRALQPRIVEAVSRWR